MSDPTTPAPSDSPAWRERWRTYAPWLIPLLFVVVLLSPFLRDGIPVTQIGFHVLTGVPNALEFASASLTKTDIVFRFSILVGLLGIGAHLYGEKQGWWVVSLWLTLPLTISLLYQRVLPIPVLVILGIAIGMLNFRNPPFKQPWENIVVYGLGIVGLLYAGVIMFGYRENPIAPYQLFSGLWAKPDNWREWVGNPSYQIGVVPFGLALLVLFAALPRRHETHARDALVLIGVGALLILLTLVLPVPVFYFVMLAATCFVFAAGVLPVLDTRYASLPVQIGILAVALISIYPYLQPAWLELDDIEEQRFYSYDAFGDELGLFEASVTRQDNVVTIRANWQVFSPPRNDYTVFIHVLNEAGEMVAQQDALLVDEDNVPTGQWPTGYIVQKTYTLNVTQPYSDIRLGLYDLATLQRLPVNAASSQPPTDFLSLSLP